MKIANKGGVRVEMDIRIEESYMLTHALRQPPLTVNLPLLDWKGQDESIPYHSFARATLQWA